MVRLFELPAVDLAFVSDCATREHFDYTLVTVAKTVFVSVRMPVVITHAEAVAPRFVRIIR